MNALFSSLGIESWKPVLAALLLPPVPLLLLALVAARLILWRRIVGWFALLLAVAGLWLMSTVAVAEWFVRAALHPPPALDVARQQELQRDALRKHALAVVVLGGGRELLAPEYGTSSLSARSLERLRYGLWLGRELGVPVGFAGGTGHDEKPGPAEAEIAARIAAREFNHPLRWLDDQSRDTRENAARMVVLLERDGITHVVVVTHGWHMPRARRAFEDAAEHSGTVVTVIPAPMALAPRVGPAALRWMPSNEGYTLMRQALRESVGLLMGA
jgi:uncharacterized SAM-binding protein YcdF (DUF218 family)